MLFVSEITLTKGEQLPSAAYSVAESQSVVGLRNLKKKKARNLGLFTKISFSAWLIAQPFTREILMCATCLIPVMEKRKTVLLSGAQ